MKEIKMATKDKRGYYSFLKDDDFEYANPIEKMAEIVIEVSISQMKNHLLFARENKLLPVAENSKINSDALIEKVACEKALKIWEEEYEKITSQEVPEALYKVLQSTTKKEQARVLRGLSLTHDELTAFIFKAWEIHGFTLSRYMSEHHHKGLDAFELPKVAYKEDDNSIISKGATSLTPGQIRQAIENRRVVVARFLDKGPLWYCFFLTFRSLKGEETGGRPHLHFISHSWEYSREYVLEQFKSNDYRLGRLPHIDYHTYRNPRP
jgi:hypothetical protein